MPNCCCRDYQNLGDGQVAIHPLHHCFQPHRPTTRPSAAASRSFSKCLMARCSSFDQPMDLSRAKIGRLMGGQLKGPVTIRSDWKEPGPEDDLLVTASGDLQLTEQTITTPSPVEFRWGPHFGRGQDMVIKLLAGQPRAGKPDPGPNVAGIESFELRHVERLHLDLGADALVAGRKAAAACRSRSTAAARSASTWWAAWPRFATAWK